METRLFSSKSSEVFMFPQPIDAPALHFGSNTEFMFYGNVEIRNL